MVSLFYLHFPGFRVSIITPEKTRARGRRFGLMWPWQVGKRIIILLTFSPNQIRVFDQTFFDQHLDLLTILTTIFILKKNLDFWPKFWIFLTYIIFDHNFDFWLNFWISTKFLLTKTFDQKFWLKQKIDLWPKFRMSPKISICDQNFNFWPKLALHTIFGFMINIFVSTKMCPK